MRARAVAAGVAACFAMSGAVASSAVASPTDALVSVAPDMTEFNLAGWQQHEGRLAPADRLIEAVSAASPRPVAVALSEVCSSVTTLGQWENIEDDLGALGYTSFFAPSITSSLGKRCRSFGNVVALLGQDTETTTRTYVAQQSGTRELRNIVCARGVTSLGELVACSTHLVPNDANDTTLTALQAAEALTFVQQFAGIPRLIGGDFNLRPENHALDLWYSDSYEGDASKRTEYQPTRDSGIKNDYVFANQVRFSDSSNAIVTEVPQSDHHLYEAKFQLRP